MNIIICTEIIDKKKIYKNILFFHIDQYNEVKKLFKNNRFWFFYRNTEKNKYSYIINNTNIASIGVDLNKNINDLIYILFAKPKLDFNFLHDRALSKSNKILWEKVVPYNLSKLIDYKELKNNGCDYNKLAIVKLNGGLGTSMKCSGPKSIIQVKNNLCFLEIIINQIRFLNKEHKCNIPLVLMNSTLTTNNQEMNKIIKDSSDIDILIFHQDNLPRICAKTNKLLDNDSFTSNTPISCPSGTGDFYESLLKSDVYPELLKRNIEHLFISNIDNLAASADPYILNYLQNNDNIEFNIEVTPKTELDIKGGTFIEYNDKTRLLEVAMVPKENLDEFYSIKKFKIFNTNNIWIRLNSLVNNYENMEIFQNFKTIDNTEFYQIESVIGSGINCFENISIINVPRNRFLPVKKNNNLEDIRSEKYFLTKSFILKSVEDNNSNFIEENNDTLEEEDDNDTLEEEDDDE